MHGWRVIRELARRAGYVDVIDFGEGWRAHDAIQKDRDDLEQANAEQALDDLADYGTDYGSTLEIRHFIDGLHTREVL